MRRSPMALAALALCLTAGSAAAQQTRPAGGDIPEPIQVERTAPAFSLPGADGETYALTDLRGKESLVLVFFRGSW